MQTVWLKESAYNAILIETIKKMPLETGGILMGYWGNNNEAVVTAVIGPGSKAIHLKRSFIPDNEYHLEEISSHYADSGQTETYLGDWHTHPKANAYLSGRDEETLIAIANHKEARLPNPLMMILGTKPFGLKVWTHSYVKHFFYTKRVISECKIKLY
ncbi:Mov34/MPN/PAD-1 family protein [Rufibacter immobilis]|uniref:Mov34/MPN/PAD-1 family protein n=1 Tax=Rufibacter immobilis TaxID=1348778 RepID=UPI001C836BC0|nr:Mov34/MPN/PAD-1 family protein [Rufibacter immobilis]